MRGLILIFSSFFVAFILTLLPIPEWAVWLRPVWVLLTLIYWAAVMPDYVNVGCAWLVGLCLDVLNGTLLGEHALAATIVIYFIVRIHTRFRMFSLLQQSLFVFLLTLLYQFILFCIQGFIGEMPRQWTYWMASVTSLFLWPWVFVILHDCRRRFRVASIN